MVRNGSDVDTVGGGVGNEFEGAMDEETAEKAGSNEASELEPVCCMLRRSRPDRPAPLRRSAKHDANERF